MEWYYAEADRKMGPVGEDELKRLLAEGMVGGGTMVWRQGMSAWAELGTVLPDLASSAPAAPGAATAGITCSQCGRRFPPGEVIKLSGTWVCAACKPIFVQRLKEGAALPGIAQYAGFWIRFAAKIIDGMILAVPNFVVMALTAILTGTVMKAAGMADAVTAVVAVLVNWTFQLGLPVVYNTFFVGRFAATPGKMACGLQVILPGGGKVSYARAFGRCFAEWVSGFTLGIGYIIAGFDREKRALHDHICGTRVAKKQRAAG
ncbi:MAG: RDD family protein [Deltaproteobacteria bacterium]|nr:RDD family protein [Deltaproteobacteria bacterium]